MPNIRLLNRRIPRVNQPQARDHAAALTDFNAGNVYGVWDLGTYKVYSYNTLLVAVSHGGSIGFDNQSFYSMTTSHHHGIARAALRNVKVLGGFAYHGELGHSAAVDYYNRIDSVGPIS